MQKNALTHKTVVARHVPKFLFKVALNLRCAQPPAYVLVLQLTRWRPKPSVAVGFPTVPSFAELEDFFRATRPWSTV